MQSVISIFGLRFDLRPDHARRHRLAAAAVYRNAAALVSADVKITDEGCARDAEMPSPRRHPGDKSRTSGRRAYAERGDDER